MGFEAQRKRANQEAAREALVGEPRALPKVLLAVDWSAKSQVREAYRLLGKGAPLPPLHALSSCCRRETTPDLQIWRRPAPGPLAVIDVPFFLARWRPGNENVSYF